MSENSQGAPDLENSEMPDSGPFESLSQELSQTLPEPEISSRKFLNYYFYN